MFKTLLFLIVGACAIAPAYAQNYHTMDSVMHCNDKERVKKVLSEDWGEQPLFVGLDSKNNLMQYWANEEKRTWTVTITFPTGVMCVVTSGNKHQAMSVVPTGEEL